MFSQFERKNIIMERETMQHLWIDIFFPLFWSLQIEWCRSALQQQEGLLKTKTTGTTLTVFKFVSWKIQWLYISTLTPRSTCLFLWSLKRDQKITLEIRGEHSKLKLNVHGARKLIHTTNPCKHTFGISILGKWRLPYPRADISREPVLISKRAFCW